MKSWPKSSMQPYAEGPVQARIDGGYDRVLVCPACHKRIGLDERQMDELRVIFHRCPHCDLVAPVPDKVAA